MKPAPERSCEKVHGRGAPDRSPKHCLGPLLQHIGCIRVPGQDNLNVLPCDPEHLFVIGCPCGFRPLDVEGGKIYDSSPQVYPLPSDKAALIGNPAYDLLRKQGYGMVGRHSAVKLCHWLRKSLRGKGHCYKQEFYGIQSHRCLQMSPSVAHCDFRCIYCWRPVEFTQGVEMGEEIDGPEEIVSGSIASQRKLLSGYGGVPDLVPNGRFKEALEPKHAAISLAGEPTLYPRLGELIHEYSKRGMTTFLVTNGSFPAALENLTTEPTQLYISLSAPSEALHLSVNRPIVKGSWKSIMESLDLIGSFGCRTVVRLTLARGLNMVEAGSYAELVGRSSPDFVEVKAYMFVGWSRHRLTIGNMPSFVEIRRFADSLQAASGYQKECESASSRVVLLARDPGSRMIRAA